MIELINEILEKLYDYVRKGYTPFAILVSSDIINELNRLAKENFTINGSGTPKTFIRLIIIRTVSKHSSLYYKILCEEKIYDLDNYFREV